MGLYEWLTILISAAGVIVALVAVIVQVRTPKRE